MKMTQKELDNYVVKKAKELFEKMIKPYTTIDPKDRAKLLGLEEEKPTGLVFEDREGRKHKAYGPKEKLFSGDSDFSVGKILRAKILGDFSDLNDTEMKSAGEGIGALGGWLVPTEVSAKVIDMARNLACVMQAGAYTMIMPTPEMRLVKITGDPSAYWVAEHGEIAESDWTLEPVNLKAMTIGVLVRSSLELLEDAKNAGSALQGAMAKALALEMDRVALLGTGTNEPRGLDNCDGVNLISKGVDGGTITNYDDFSNAVEDVADNNGIAGAVIFAPRTFYTLDRLKEGTTLAPLPAPESYKNLKNFSTNQIGIADTQGTATNASKAFVGDYKNILYGIRKALEIEFSRTAGQKTFAKCEALIRCRMRLDIAVLRENHFTKIEGIIPA
jgi:HK97 family phage major capsid protein